MILCNARLREPMHYLLTCWINPLVCPGCVLHKAVHMDVVSIITYCQFHGYQSLCYVYIPSSSFYKYYRTEH